MKKFLSLFIAVICLLSIPVNADPIDEAYWKTFYITTLGGFNTVPNNVNNIFYYRDRLLALNGGVMPKNLKIGYGGATWFLMSTQGSYYDYIYIAREVTDQLKPSLDSDSHIGYFINGMPWGDSADQSLDILHNYLEKYNGGELLQKDRSGRIRMASLAQDPTINEQVDAFAPYLEMQLTLSRNASVVQDYVGRNNHIAAGTINWQREQHPDLIVFTTMSSEYAQNTSANHDYCDYSDWSKQEFRDWLSGTGFYVGQGQYATLTDFNNAFGFSYSSWGDVEPPTTVNWTGGSYWQKWNDFRIVQVGNMEQTQIDWTQRMGWNPDRVYGHQIPFDPNTVNDIERKLATPWTTAFVENGSDGITTYGPRASDSIIFNAISADNKNWGIFEYNPLDTSVANNLSALDTVWNTGGHIVCPYLWYGQPTYQILSNSLETALQQFISNRSSDSYSETESYEVAPGSKNIIWAMSESDDVESSSDLTSIIFLNGIMSANVSGTSPSLSLELDESSHYLVSDSYNAGSFRMYIENPGTNGKIEWHDNMGNTSSINFVPRQGWNVYKINMAGDVNWRNKNINEIKFYPGAMTGSEVKIDWLRFEANHCWNFDSSNEIYGQQNLTGEIFTNGVFSATDTAGDGYFYFSTDQNAKRAFIDAEYSKKIRFKMTSSANATCQFFWWTQTSGPFWNYVHVQAGSHSYELDLSDDTNWTGKIRVFRMDPVNGNGVSFSVEYVNVSPILLPPRMAAPDLVVNSPLPIFTWDKLVEPSGAGMTYSLDVAVDFDFNTIVYSQTGLTGSTNIYNGEGLADGLFWWRIRSESSGGDVSSWSPPMAMFIRPWTFDRLEDIKSTHAMGTPTVANGIWKAAVTGGDPYAYFNVSSARGVNADLYKKFYTRIRMTPNSGGSENVQFIYFPRRGSAYSASTQSVPRDGQWHTVEVDLSADLNWYGDIAAFRIDPGDGASLTLEIDSAYFMPEDAENVSITTPSLPDGMWNTSYQSQLTSTGTVGLTSWSLISGTLHAGLFLTSSGMITGTPTETGIKPLTFEVNDQLERSSSKQLTLDIVPEPCLFIIYYLSFIIYYRRKFKSKI